MICSVRGEDKNAQAKRISVRISERKRPLGKPRRSSKNITKMDLTEIMREGMDWIQLARIE
jgi:hypothetical protein